MGMLKNNASGQVFTTSQDPVWSAGSWNCGDQVFGDPDGTHYTPIPHYTPPAAADVSAILTASQAAITARKVRIFTKRGLLSRAMSLIPQ